jgi:hypothetical protein
MGRRLPTLKENEKIFRFILSLIFIIKDQITRQNFVFLFFTMLVIVKNQVTSIRFGVFYHFFSCIYKNRNHQSKVTKKTKYLIKYLTQSHLDLSIKLSFSITLGTLYMFFDVCNMYYFLCNRTQNEHVAYIKQAAKFNFAAVVINDGR